MPCVVSLPLMAAGQPAHGKEYFLHAQITRLEACFTNHSTLPLAKVLKYVELSVGPGISFSWQHRCIALLYQKIFGQHYRRYNNVSSVTQIGFKGTIKIYR